MEGSDVTEQEVRKEDKPTIDKGFLFKQGHVVKNWKQRYFVLSSNALVYYENEKQSNSGKPKGTISLKEAKIQQEEAQDKYPFLFSISTSGGKTLIAAKDADELKVWIRSIRRKIKSLSLEFRVQSSRSTVLEIVSPNALPWTPKPKNGRKDAKEVSRVSDDED